MTLQDHVRELHAADRQKDRFMALLAHELRNPLAPVKTAVQTMRLVTIAEPTVVAARDIIERRVSQMAHLIDDLLDMSRVKYGKLTMQKEHLVLPARAVVAHRRVLRGHRLSARQHELTLNVPDEVLPINADPTRLEQLVCNLVNNAAKYTPPHGRVEIALERAGKEAVLRVRDNGIGIEPEILPRLFNIFAQAERPSGDSQGGLGLGLALVKESRAACMAARWKLTATTSPAAAHLPPCTCRCCRSAGFSSRGAARNAKTRTAGGVPRRIVLVIEDMADSRSDAMAEMLLRLYGHEVVPAENGETGIARVCASHPDVVLVDIGLPDMNGYEVARRLRAAPECRGTLLVALTGYGQVEDQRRALEAGFDLHLTKPVDAARLCEVLAHAQPQMSYDAFTFKRQPFDGCSLRTIERMLSKAQRRFRVQTWHL